MTLSTGSDSNVDRPWRATWCWTARRSSRPWNLYALFRSRVLLPAKPSSAIVRISADARYTLYVNGRRVHQGPARCRPGIQSYDEINLADVLQGGPNALCAIVHQFGVPTAQSAYRDASGFLLDGLAEIDGQEIPLHTPDGWLCREALGWRKNVVRLSDDLGFQEHFDADADPIDWLGADYQATEASGWRAPVIVAPVGGYPWVKMSPRGIPLLADQVMSFSSIVAQFTGENARGYKVAEDVFHLPIQETRKKAKIPIENPEAMLRDDDQPGILAPPADGEFHMAVLDLGQARTAHIVLDVMEAAGDEIIDILYTSALDRNQSPLVDETGPALADRYRCRPGPQRWESFAPRGFRYATLILRNVEKPLKLRHIGIRSIRAAIDPIGTFACNDEILTAIHKAGVETLRACMLDGYVDSPERSQAQRWPDLAAQSRAAEYCFADHSLLHRAIVLAARSQAADGSLHACAPADDPHGRVIDGMLAWIGSLWDYYFHTGQTALPRDCRETLDRLLDFLTAHERLDGLIGGFAGFEIAIDARDLHKTELSATLNLLYLQSLRHAAGIYQVLDLHSESDRITARADALARALVKHLWDPKAKVWKDGIDPQTLKPVDGISVHANALAVLLRLAPEQRGDVARDVILKGMRAKRGKLIAASPAFGGYVLDALIEAGLRAEAIDLIRDKWGAMIADGATTLWQEWNGDTGSRCFSAAAAPVALLAQQVLGVTPVAVGWKKVRIAPLVGKLEFARGAVPTSLGPIRVEWEKVGDDQLAVRVELPEGMDGEFVGPLGEARDLKAGATEFHT